MQRTRTIILIVVACILCLERTINCDVSAEKSKSIEIETSKTGNDGAKSPNIDVKVKGKPTTNEPLPKTGSEDLTSKSKQFGTEHKAVQSDASSTSERPAVVHSTSLNSGALLRGFWVFVGISMIVLAYMVFRSFRVNKSRTQMVRKYGVLAHKQDIEMRPLPLDEDDEDDTTVFDATGLAPPRPQS